MSDKIHRIVLTGGPCGGKTTALSFITDRLRSLGYNVFVVPEAATLFILGGTQLNIESDFVRMQTQGALTKAIIALEDSFTEI
ncbi:MAG TPA: AAA family ATPase, partial [Anaerovoracaceae bacterium]|nr:AAA family ATPase [Anaerovoracaceae bacterium]